MKNYKLSILAGAMLASATLHAQSTIAQVEFFQDDQAGFDLWGGTALSGASATESYTTGLVSSGAVDLTVSASSALATVGSRGSISDGTPAGFTYENLYRDILLANTSTGALTLSFSGLDASTEYEFILYAWDPGNSDNIDREWTITGSGTALVDSVNFTDTLVDNDTFAMVFNVTTTASGTFTAVNTNGLQGSAINGFALSTIPEPSAFAMLSGLLALSCVMVRRR